MFYRFVKNVLEDLTAQNPPNKGTQRHEHKLLSKDTFQSKFLFNLDDINRGNVCVCARATKSNTVEKLRSLKQWLNSTLVT